MALLYAEKFSRYSVKGDVSALNDSNSSGTAWSNGVGSGSDLDSTGGRWGEKCLRLKSAIEPYSLPWVAVTADTTIIVGAAIYYHGRNHDTAGTGLNVPGCEVFVQVSQTAAASFGSSTAIHWGVGVTPGGTLIFLRSGNKNDATKIIGRVPGILQPRTWHYLEVKVGMVDSGTMTVKLDGVQIFTVSATDFLNAALVLTYLTIGGVTGEIAWDDLIVMDGAGGTFNDFMGDMRFECKVPSADGSTLNWTSGNAGANYTNIDDALGAYNKDTGSDYIYDAVTDDINLATHAALSMTDQTAIKFVKLDALARSEGAGDKIADLVKSGATTDTGADIALPTGAANTYFWRYKFWELDPNTAAAWTLTNLNASEWGVKKRV